MRHHDSHWSAIGRALSTQVQGLGRNERVEAVRVAAERTGLAPHTLQRYVVLSDFLATLGVGEEEAGKLNVATMEVVLRVWRLDPNQATVALRGLKAGRLSYRDALKVERRVRGSGGLPADFAPQEASGDDVRSEVMRLLQAGRAGDVPALTEVSPIDDERFALVQVHRVFRAGPTRVAFLDEAATLSGTGPGRSSAMLGSVLMAAALFDHVLVRLARRRSAAEVSDLAGLCRPGAVDNVHVTMVVEGGARDA